jgi:protein SCO1
MRHAAWIGWSMGLALTVHTAGVWANTPFPPNQEKTLGTVLPEVHFTDDSGKEFLLSELRGKPLILNPIFASCKHTCSPIIQNLKKALPADAKLGVDYHLLTFSFDPKDDVARMQTLRTQHGLAEPWRLAVGNKDEVRRLLDALDFRYLTLEEDGFAHSNFVVAADSDQKIRFYLLGVTQDPNMFLRALEVAQGRGQWKERLRIILFFVSLAGLLASSWFIMHLRSRAHAKRLAV